MTALASKLSIAEALDSFLKEPMPLRFTAYDGTHLAAVKERYDPDDRLLSLYDKAVRDR